MFFGSGSQNVYFLLQFWISKKQLDGLGEEAGTGRGVQLCCPDIPNITETLGRGPSIHVEGCPVRPWASGPGNKHRGGRKGFYS